MLSAVKRWWFAPAPAERLAALRIAIGAYALVYTLARLPELIAVATLHRGSFAPLGPIRILHAPLPPAVSIAIVVATLILLGAFVVGFRWRIIAPLAAAAFLWTMSYRNSWGQPFHTENLVVLHLIALACAPAADAWSLDPPRSDRGYGWAIKLLAALVVATYLLAGIAKLRLAGVAWLDGEQLRNQIAVDNARKVLLGATPSFIATPLLEHPAWFTGFSIATLIVELGAPLALVHPRIARVWAITAWAFHLGVLALMHILFPYPLLGVAFLPFVDAEHVLERGRGMFRRRSPV